MADKQQTIFDFNIASGKQITNFLDAFERGLGKIVRQLVSAPPLTEIFKPKDVQKTVKEIEKLQSEVSKAAQRGLQSAVTIPGAADGVGKQIAGGIERAVRKTTDVATQEFSRRTGQALNEAMMKGDRGGKQLLGTVKSIAGEFKNATGYADSISPAMSRVERPVRLIKDQTAQTNVHATSTREQTEQTIKAMIQNAAIADRLAQKWSEVVSNTRQAAEFQQEMAQTAGVAVMSNLNRALATASTGSDTRFTETKKILREIDKASKGATTYAKDFQAAVKGLRGEEKRTAAAVKFLESAMAELVKETKVADKTAELTFKSMQKHLEDVGYSAREATNILEDFSDLDIDSQVKALDLMAAKGVGIDRAIDLTEIEKEIEFYRERAELTDQTAEYEKKLQDELKQYQQYIKQIDELLTRTSDIQIRNRMEDFKYTLEGAADVIKDKLNRRLEESNRRLEEATDKVRQLADRMREASNRVADMRNRAQNFLGGGYGGGFVGSVHDLLTGGSSYDLQGEGAKVTGQLFDLFEIISQETLQIQNQLNNSRGFATFRNNMGKLQSSLISSSQRIPVVGTRISGLINNVSARLGGLTDRFLGGDLMGGIGKFGKVLGVAGVAIEGVNVGLDIYNRLMGKSGEEIQSEINRIISGFDKAQEVIDLVVNTGGSALSSIDSQIRDIERQIVEQTIIRDQMLYSGAELTDEWSKWRTVIEYAIGGTTTMYGEFGDKVHEANQEISRLNTQLEELHEAREAAEAMDALHKSIDEVADAVRSYVEISQQIQQAEEEYMREMTQAREERARAELRAAEEAALEELFEQEDWNRERLEAWMNHLEAVGKIQDDLHREIQEAEENLAKERKQAWDNLQKELNQLQLDENKQIVEMQASFHEEQQKSTEEHYKQLGKQEEEYRLDRLRREQDLFDQLTDLEIANDVLGYMQAKRDAEKEFARSQEDHERQVSEQQQQFEEQQAEAAAQHQKAMDDLRIQNAERRREMIAQYNEEKALREAEHKERLAEMRKQAQEQLQQQIDSYAKSEAEAFAAMQREAERERMRQEMRERFEREDQEREQEARRQAHEQEMQDLQDRLAEELRILAEHNVDLRRLNEETDKILEESGKNQALLQRRTNELVAQYREEGNQRVLEAERAFFDAQMELYRQAQAVARTERQQNFANSLGGQINRNIGWWYNQLGIHPTSIGTLGLRTRAGGGDVRANEPYIVGENGPELLIPRQSGTVITNQELTNMIRRSQNLRRVSFAQMVSDTGVGSRTAQEELERWERQAAYQFSDNMETAENAMIGFGDEMEMFNQAHLDQLLQAAMQQHTQQLQEMDDFARRMAEANASYNQQELQAQMQAFTDQMGLLNQTLSTEYMLNQQSDMSLLSMQSAYNSQSVSIDQAMYNDALFAQRQFGREFVGNLGDFVNAIGMAAMKISTAVDQIGAALNRLPTGGFDKTGSNTKTVLKQSKLAAKGGSVIGGGGSLLGLKFREKGGDVAKGVGYIVGEVGPELFIPRHNGMILSHEMTSAFLRGIPIPALGSAQYQSTPQKQVYAPLTIGSVSVGSGMDRVEVERKLSKLQQAVVEAVVEAVEAQ